MISMPLNEPDQGEYLILKGLQDENEADGKVVFGKRAKHFPINAYRDMLVKNYIH